jgi:hypothetical protein
MTPRSMFAFPGAPAKEWMALRLIAKPERDQFILSRRAGKGDFPGHLVTTIQPWRLGISASRKMACRMMDQIRRDPGHWRKALRELLVAK